MVLNLTYLLHNALIRVKWKCRGQVNCYTHLSASRCSSEQWVRLTRKAECLTGAQVNNGCLLLAVWLWCECPSTVRTCLNLSFLSCACSRLGEVCSANQSPDEQQGRPAAAGSQRAEGRECPQALPPGWGKGEGWAHLNSHFSGVHGLRNDTKWMCWFGGDLQDPQILVLAGRHT